MSLHATNATGDIIQYVGLSNFVDLLVSEAFYYSFKNTATFSLMTIPATLAVSLILAILTSRGTRRNTVFQFIFSITLAVPAGIASVIWVFLYHPSAGMMNHFLGLFGLSKVGWLTDPSMAMVSVSIMTVWLEIGFVYLVLLSGIKGIPEDLYESARMDGAGSMASAFYVTLPLLSPTLFFVGVISVIGSFQTFTQIEVLTGGGPVNATNVVVYELYKEAFVYYRFGTGSAQALVLFLILLILTLIQFRLAERRVHYS
ncbi:sugar ABC transporter permease [Paenibacillus sp. TRM 82003]|nr:sugar ABC transporter permease [Paenibacillus sp. TRM 82003]